MRAEVEVEKGVYLRVDDQPYRSAVAAVAAVRTTERLELLAMHRGTAMATVAGRHVDRDAVDEPRHRMSFLRNENGIRE